ncbi:MAG: Asp23/Gls24 family envelope stress response protein [Actinobacteria bacterium]|nr:MAG: Asp23/Gls24 family envelope stress response protein [Actinomycetota bacterium]
MTDEIRLEGLGIAPGVLDTIVKLAAESVDGVAAVGAPGVAGLVQKGARKGTARAVDVCQGEDGVFDVTVHVQVTYGSKLREVARGIQVAVAEALASQLGADMGAVDVYIDGLVFDE